MIGRSDPVSSSSSSASSRVIEATNKGLKGMEKQAYINSGKLSLKGDETAANDALKAVFQNDTSLGTIAAKLKNAPQSIKDPNSRVAAQLAVDILIPFVKIPSAVATALVDYSPVGLAAEVAKQGFRQELDIRNLNNAIGKSTVGTAGAIYIGSQLYDKGMLTLEAPQDTNERQLWALEGKQPFSVKINGKWRKLNYVQPFGSLMAVGGGFNRAKKEGENPYASSIASGMKAVSDQSFLKGVAGAVSAVQDPARSADTFLNNTAGSVVPNFIRDLARATDSKEREVNSVKEAVKNGLPGLRNDNLPQRDPFGNEIKRKQSPAGVMLDPFKSTTDKTDPVTSEIRRLYDIDRTNPDLKAAPSKLTKQQTFAGEDVVLTPEQLDKFEATVGPAAYSKITQAMQTPEYKAGTDVDKAKDIKDIISETRANSKADFATTNKLQDKKKQDVTLDATKFKERTTTLGASSGSGTKVAANADAQTKKVLGEYNSLSKEEVNKKAYKEYDYDYKVAKARYENAKAKGEYSKADDLAARDRVRKLKAGSGFSKDTRDYYSLSSDQLARLVETDPEGTKIVEQVLAYGDKLTAEGVQTKNKFRDKKGNVTIATNKAKAAASGAKGRRSSGSASVAKASVDYSGTNKLAGMSRGKFRSSTNGGKSIARKVRQQSYKVKRTLPKRVKGVA